MGVAAYRRGTEVIRKQIDSDSRIVEFQIMEDLTSLPKFDYARTPFNDIYFVAGHNGWWAVCPITEYGYWYKTLRDAVRSWKVAIIGFDKGKWLATPL